MIRYLRLLAISLFLIFSGIAHAQLNIEVVGAGMQRIPVAVPNFGGDDGLGREIAAVVRSDLASTGLFNIINTDSLVAEENSSVDFAAWRSRGADQQMPPARPRMTRDAWLGFQHPCCHPIRIELRSWFIVALSHIKIHTFVWEIFHYCWVWVIGQTAPNRAQINCLKDAMEDSEVLRIK